MQRVDAINAKRMLDFETNPIHSCVATSRRPPGGAERGENGLDSFDHPEIGMKRYPVVSRKPVAKAVPMHRDRSTRPGGHSMGPKRPGASWGDRRRFREEVCESPKSRCGFGWQNTGDEWVRALECPEIDGGKAKG